MGMAYEEAFRIVGALAARRLDLNDGILAARYDKPVWVCLIRWEEVEGVYVFGSTAEKGSLERWRGALVTPPDADCAVSRCGKDKVGRGEANDSHLRSVVRAIRPPRAWAEWDIHRLRGLGAVQITGSPLLPWRRVGTSRWDGGVLRYRGEEGAIVESG